jgi:hypothetical protein
MRTTCAQLYLDVDDDTSSNLCAPLYRKEKQQVEIAKRECARSFARVLMRLPRRVERYVRVAEGRPGATRPAGSSRASKSLDDIAARTLKPPLQRLPTVACDVDSHRRHLND